MKKSHVAITVLLIALACVMLLQTLEAKTVKNSVADIKSYTLNCEALALCSE